VTNYSADYPHMPLEEIPTFDHKLGDTNGLLDVHTSWGRPRMVHG